jgi:H+/Cl- antiporter ClcA
MIHAGSIVGAAASQGKTITLGFDTSWTKFQDLRNDRSKRDFVTFGAAAGVAAAFSAPIGGILFTLEEGASFWSTTLTFRAFFCAMVTELTVNLVNSGFTLGVDTPQSMFDFGRFDDFRGYATFELVIFVCIGCMGGVMGAFFNYINKRVTIFRTNHLNNHTWKRMLELVLLTAGWATVCYILPKMYNTCTPLPGEVANMTPQQVRRRGICCLLFAACCCDVRQGCCLL